MESATSRDFEASEASDTPTPKGTTGGMESATSMDFEASNESSHQRPNFEVSGFHGTRLSWYDFRWIEMSEASEAGGHPWR